MFKLYPKIIFSSVMSILILIGGIVLYNIYTNKPMITNADTLQLQTDEAIDKKQLAALQKSGFSRDFIQQLTYRERVLYMKRGGKVLDTKEEYRAVKKDGEMTIVPTKEAYQQLISDYKNGKTEDIASLGRIKTVLSQVESKKYRLNMEYNWDLVPNQLKDDFLEIDLQPHYQLLRNTWKGIQIEHYEPLFGENKQIRTEVTAYRDPLVKAEQTEKGYQLPIDWERDTLVERVVSYQFMSSFEFTTKKKNEKVQLNVLAPKLNVEVEATNKK